jgi:hypothetical protein
LPICSLGFPNNTISIFELLNFSSSPQRSHMLTKAMTFDCFLYHSSDLNLHPGLQVSQNPIQTFLEMRASIYWKATYGVTEMA